MGTNIKIKLLELGKRQTDLLYELRKRGFPKLTEQTLSKYINHVAVNPQAQQVREEIYCILDEWEKERIIQNT